MRRSAFVGDAYRTHLRRPGKTIEHPIAVATLLADDGQPPLVVIAGILHDVLEDTDATPNELDLAVGPNVARLVSALSEDPSIRRYRKRKSALRRQIVDAGPAAAAVSLADKVAKLRAVESPARGAQAGPLQQDPPGDRAALQKQPIERAAAGGAGSLARRLTATHHSTAAEKPSR